MPAAHNRQSVSNTFQESSGTRPPYFLSVAIILLPLGSIYVNRDAQGLVVSWDCPWSSSDPEFRSEFNSEATDCCYGMSVCRRARSGPVSGQTCADLHYLGCKVHPASSCTDLTGSHGWICALDLGSSRAA